MKLLLVEADSMLRRTTAALLMQSGDTVVEAATGEAAWQLLQAQRISLLITSWTLPELDGLDLIRRLRAAEQGYYTYAIMLTQHHDPQVVVVALQAGADDYLVKPYHPEELLARVLVGQRIIALEEGWQAKHAYLQQQAQQDALTGLLNHRAIMERARIALEYAQRTRQPLSLIVADLDHFKRVNDQYGHVVGDQVLHAVATYLHSVVRPYDEVGRWGGEEFLLVLPATPHAAALTIAERLRATLAETPLVLTNGHTLALTLSLGVASYDPVLASTLEVLVEQADSALYAAKRGGRNRTGSLTRRPGLEEGPAPT